MRLYILDQYLARITVRGHCFVCPGNNGKILCIDLGGKQLLALNGTVHLVLLMLDLFLLYVGGLSDLLGLGPLVMLDLMLLYGGYGGAYVLV
jgi:hypothetical protein